MLISEPTEAATEAAYSSAKAMLKHVISVAAYKDTATKAASLRFSSSSSLVSSPFSFHNSHVVLDVSF